MPLRRLRGTTKPPVGARLNYAHPFSRGLLFCIPILEAQLGKFGTFEDLYPSVLFGATARFALTTGSASLPLTIATNEGLAVALTTGTNYAAGNDPFPAQGGTVAIVGHKTDSTARDSGLFGVISATGANLFGAYVPYVDGTVYFDYGGTGGANRLSIGGLTFSTTRAEHWIFTAGARGSAIWRNGVKIASQTSAVSRTPNTAAPFRINAGAGPIQSGDNFKLNYFAAYGVQWDDALCRAWSAAPYVHLHRDLWRSVVPVGGAGAAGHVPNFIHHYKQQGIL